MHDDLLERRLRSALREEGDGLSFTITAAQLERRMAMRGRRSGSRLTLLLAATIAIGALGVVTILGGLSNKPTPSPIVASTTPRPSETGATPGLLPSLDALIATDPARVLLAQAQGPADRPPQPIPDAIPQKSPLVGLGDVQADGDYAVSVACLGATPLTVTIQAIGSINPPEPPTFDCDGAVHEATIRVDGPASAWVTFAGPTSWRVVVRGDRSQLPLPTGDPILAPFNDGWEELIRLEDATAETGAEAWGARGLELRGVGTVPARVDYIARVWCEAGGTFDLVFADRIEGVLTPSIETQLACDGLAHDLPLWVPLRDGSPVAVAATPSTRWSVLIVAGGPPISLANDVPGWQLQDAIGPSLHFESTEVSISDVAGERGGPLMVVLECAGASQEIQLKADVKGILGDAFQTYPARCEPAGERTSWTFNTAATGFIIGHEAPASTWTALTVLIPDPSPGP